MTVVAADGNTRDIKVADGYTYSINGTSITWRSEVSPYTGQPYWTYAGARIPANPGGTDARGYYQQQLDLDSGHAFRATWAMNYDPLFRGLTNSQEIEPGLATRATSARVFMFRSHTTRDIPRSSRSWSSTHPRAGRSHRLSSGWRSVTAAPR